MANATASNSSGEWDADCRWYRDHEYFYYKIAYFFITPSYFVMGLIGHVLCLVAFREQAKKEGAYVYQVFVVISETIELFTYITYIASFSWFSGADSPGVDWFQSCYICMCHAAHVAIPLVNMSITNSMLFAIAVASDRIFALLRPFSYRTANHKRNQKMTLLLCYGIGVSTSLYDTFRLNVQFNEATQLYAIVTNDAFYQNTLAIFLGQFRNGLRICGLLVMICCNFALVLAYRARTRKVAVTSTTTGETERQRRKVERTLALLAIFQSIFNTIGMSFLVTYYVMGYAIKSYVDCFGYFFRPFADALIQMADLADFYVVFAVNKDFRRMIFEANPILKKLFGGKCGSK